MRTIVVMPAYNAEKTLAKTIEEIPFDAIDEIILVDDASQDRTLSVARNIGASHPRLALSPEQCTEGRKLLSVVALANNRGYGGNQKECYRRALAHGAEIVVMLHPDYQYDPKKVEGLVDLIRKQDFAVALGNRIQGKREAGSGGMPPYRYYANRFLSFVENKASGQAFPEWHSGMRAYRSDVLSAIGFERFSDGFVFDTQMLFAIVERGYKVGWISIPTRYGPGSSSISFGRGLAYGLATLKEALAYRWRRRRTY